MIRDYTEILYYPLVKVRAHKSYTLQEATALIRGLLAAMVQGEDCIDSMLDSPTEMIWAFEGRHTCDRFEAESQERYIISYLQGAIPEGWEICD